MKRWNEHKKKIDFVFLNLNPKHQKKNWCCQCRIYSYCQIVIVHAIEWRRRKNNNRFQFSWQRVKSRYGWWCPLWKNCNWVVSIAFVSVFEIETFFFSNEPTSLAWVVVKTIYDNFAFCAWIHINQWLRLCLCDVFMFLPLNLTFNSNLIRFHLIRFQDNSCWIKFYGVLLFKEIHWRSSLRTL